MKSPEDIFDEARRLASEERLLFLDEACEGDDELRARVESLLRDAEEAEQFFGELSGAPTVDVSPDRKRAEVEGEWIGPYKLLEPLGEGGFGTVFLADQREPIKRQVALKIIKPGMDSRQVIARFEAERQALALMSHPNIADVLDGGTTDAGRPYFVMELVRGLPVTRHCDKHRLSTRERLQVFQGICSAVQHAHQKGIIHRDLKPSNILVVETDDGPLVKVIDFGVAKALQQPLTEGTLYTRAEQLLGTPLYMSPEQADGDNRDIDTRSDIYSLGVILYELLAGKPPIDASELLQAGFEEMCRLIREKTPPKPSTRVSTCDERERSEIAEHRGAQPGRLGNSLKGDLDWVVMKALEKEPDRRYSSAAAFREDLQRFLENHPVEARPPSASYRVRKFVRRYRWQTGAALTILGLVTAGAIVSSVFAVQAEADRRLALDRLEEVEDVSAFVIDILKSPDPRLDGRKVTVMEVLDRAAGNLDEFEDTHPKRHARLAETLGNSYLALGIPRRAIPLLEVSLVFHQDQGESHRAEAIRIGRSLARAKWILENREEAAEEAFNLYQRSQRLFGATDGRTLAVMVQAGAYLGRIEEPPYGDITPWMRAVDLLTRALPLCEEHLGAEHSETLEALAALSDAYGNLWLYGNLDSGTRADIFEKLRSIIPVYGKADLQQYPIGPVQLRLEVLRRMKAALGEDHPSTLAARIKIGTDYTLGIGGPMAPGGLKILKAVRETLEERAGRGSIATIDCMYWLARSYWKQGDRAQALPILEEVLERCLEEIGYEYRTLVALHDVVSAYYSQGLKERAESVARDSLAESLERVDCSEESRAGLRLILASCLDRAGNPREALELRREAYERYSAEFHPGHLRLTRCVSDLVDSYQRMGMKSELLALRREIAERWTTNKPGSFGALGSQAEWAAEAIRLGHYDLAGPLVESVAAAVNRHGENVVAVSKLLYEIAHAYHMAKRYPEANRIYLLMLDLEKRLANRPGSLTTIYSRLGMMAEFLGDVPKAAHWFELAIESVPKLQRGVDKWNGPLRSALAKIYRKLGREEDADRLLKEAQRYWLPPDEGRSK